jgi:hypothetical protein
VGKSSTPPVDMLRSHRAAEAELWTVSRLSTLWICATDRQILVLNPYSALFPCRTVTTHLNTQYTPVNHHINPGLGHGHYAVLCIEGPIPAPDEPSLWYCVQAGVILAPTSPLHTIGLIAAPLGRTCASLR